MTRRKTVLPEDFEIPKDHPDQAVDTPLPGAGVEVDAFKALQDEYEGDPEEVDGQSGDDDG